MHARSQTFPAVSDARSEAPGLPWLSFRRPGGNGDLEAIARVANRSLSADRIDRILSVAGASLESHSDSDLLLVEADGESVGCLWLQWGPESAGQRIYRHEAMLSPEWRRRGIGTAILRHAHQQLRRTASAVGIRRSSFLQAAATGTQLGALVLLLREGYVAVRHRYFMLCDHLDLVPPGQPELGLAMRASAAPEREGPGPDGWFHPICEPGAGPLGNGSEGPEAFGYSLWDGDQELGWVRGHINREENAALGRSRGYLSALAVRSGWQGKALERALLGQAIRHLQAAGMREAAMEAHTESTSAGLRLIDEYGFRIFRRTTVFRRGFNS